MKTEVSERVRDTSLMSYVCWRLTGIDFADLLFLPVRELDWLSVLAPPPDRRLGVPFRHTLEGYVPILPDHNVCARFRRNLRRDWDHREGRT